MNPYHIDHYVKLYQGDALEILRTLPDASVHCCVTSPPYYGLRDYGNPAQIGLEETPQEYVARLVEVFREVRRVLRTDGTCWVNLGDSYATNRGYQVSPTKWKSLEFGASNAQKVPEGYKPKDMLMIPARVAIALQDDGWYLRADIIWHKPNAMPESVTDRPTKAHEYVFLLTKSTRYWYDHEAIKEPSVSDHGSGNGFKRTERLSYNGRGNDQPWEMQDTRNARTVWTLATQPYHGAHFAVMPKKLAQRCILAGCPEGGTVLDPFAGSGTTGDVARNMDRQAVLIDLNAEYCALIRERLAQQILPLFG